MTGLAAQYNTGINNDSHVIRIILENTFPSDLNTIIDQEYLLETIIKNCLVNANSKGTDIKYNEWKSEFLKNTSITLVLSENGHSSLLQLKDDLLTLRAINKKIKRINQNFKEKIISDLSVDGTNDWAHFVNWLENTHKPYIEKPNIKNNTLKEALTAWLTENKEVQLSYLEKNVKDFLHSEINKSIILGKIKGDDGWHSKIKESTSLKNTPLSQYEKQIREDINSITQKINPPFITAFSEELYTRCYKQLLAQQTSKEQTTTISIQLPDIAKKQLKEFKQITSVSNQFKMVYIELLYQITSTNIHIRNYAKKNINILKEIANNNELSAKEKQDIKESYFKIYSTVRHYEKETEYWNDIIEKKEHTHHPLSLFTKSLEASFHRYKPFAKALYDELKLELTKMTNNDRKKYIQIYDQTNQKLQIINECLVQLRMINKFFDEQHNIPKDTLNKFPNLDTMLTQSYQPWLDISWTKTIKQIAELFALVVVPENTMQRSREKQSVINNQSILLNASVVTDSPHSFNERA